MDPLPQCCPLPSEPLKCIHEDNENKTGNNFFISKYGVRPFRLVCVQTYKFKIKIFQKSKLYCVSIQNHEPFSQWLDKGGKTIQVRSYFFLFLSLQFTSSVVKTFKLRGKLGSLRKLKHGHSASLSSRPGCASSALGLWRERERKALSQHYRV